MLEKIFIKNYKDIENPEVRTKYGVLCSVFGIVTNIILSLLKMILGFITGSISIVADGVDNLTDCASSIATLVGFKLASMPPDPEHPYGHERIEYLTGMIISIIIIIVGVLLGRSSIDGIINKSEMNIENFNLLFIVLIFSIIIKFIQFLYYKKVSKKIKSNTIKASSQDSLNDCIKTFVVLVAVVILKVWNVNLDAWFGLGVSIYILINGIKLVKEASSPLIGESPDKDLTNKIIEKIMSYEGVLGIHDLMIHNYGPAKTFITAHVEVDSGNDILESHDLMDNIERDFMNELGLLLTIHMDPIETNDPLTNILSEFTLETLMNINSIIKFHDFRIVKGNTHVNVLFDVVVPQRFELTDSQLTDKIIKDLEPKCEQQTKVKVNFIINVDKEYI